jgi:hypothetical protein
MIDNGEGLRRKWRTRLIIAVLFGAGFFAMLGLLTFIEIPTGNREVLITLLGGLGGSVATIVAFYFGDSEH